MSTINVGLTEMHGIAQEYSQFPPEGVHYSSVTGNERYTKRIFKSHAKGVYTYIHSPEHDIIEAPLFPVLTQQPWIYTPARFSSAGTFDFLGLPTPRKIKMLFVEQLLARPNFKKLLFKSEHGRASLQEYGGITRRDIVAKTDVVYPIVRRVDDNLIEYRNDRLNLLFVGEFLRKGGANVVDAFIRIAEKYSHLTLTICASDQFQTANADLKNEYLKKIAEHPAITMAFVNREELMTKILPACDIYLCPTYQEAWGFSIQEAMAFGRPIIATNISAIPEMLEHNKSGILLDIKDQPYIKHSKGYVINQIDPDFMAYVTDAIYKQLDQLIPDVARRTALGQAALEVARTKFSADTRNQKMKAIYEAALS